MITGDGRYDVGYCERACQTHESLVGGFTLSHAILVDYQPNHLRVELRNGELTFSVNGTPVATVQGIQTGKGWWASSASRAYAGFEASFDNLQITPSEGEGRPHRTAGRRGSGAAKFICGGSLYNTFTATLRNTRRAHLSLIIHVEAPRPQLRG